MNRLERANIPSSLSVIDRSHLIITDIQRSASHGTLDVPNAISKLYSVVRNLNRLEGHLPNSQLKTVVQSVEQLKNSLNIQQSNISATNQHQRQNVVRLESTTPSVSGLGRNKLDIDLNHLQRLVDIGFSIKKIAKDGLLGGVVHPNTLYQRLKQNETPVRSNYTIINDDDLKSLVADYNRNHPNSGAEEVRAYLKTQGLLIQRDRCRHILSGVDAAGTANRWARTVHRRTYSVPMANSLWHMDTHHSLIRWGIVVHGCIDGKSRMISYLRAASCNTAEASGHFFIQGVKQYGIPSRVRADHGTEFNIIEPCMLKMRGENRGSFIRGKSVHNVRIERLWRDVFVKILYQFYTLFYYMEDSMILDINNPTHMYCLQFAFIPRIDHALRTWQNTHNNHSVRTEGNLTPQMMWLESMLLASPNATAIQNNTDIINECVQEFNIGEDDSSYLRPRFSCPLTNEDLETLQTTVDVRRHSNTMGLDVFKDVVDFIRAHS